MADLGRGDWVRRAVSDPKQWIAAMEFVRVQSAERRGNRRCSREMGFWLCGLAFGVFVLLVCGLLVLGIESCLMVFASPSLAGPSLSNTFVGFCLSLVSVSLCV